MPFSSRQPWTSYLSAGWGSAAHHHWPERRGAGGHELGATHKDSLYVRERAIEMHGVARHSSIWMLPIISARVFARREWRWRVAASRARFSTVLSAANCQWPMAVGPRAVQSAVRRDEDDDGPLAADGECADYGEATTRELRGSSP